MGALEVSGCLQNDSALSWVLGVWPEGLPSSLPSVGWFWRCRSRGRLTLGVGAGGAPVLCEEAATAVPWEAPHTLRLWHLSSALPSCPSWAFAKDELKRGTLYQFLPA